MIISERQIMQLMNLSRAYSEKLKSEGILGQTLSYEIDHILLRIQNQQSDKLREVSDE